MILALPPGMLRPILTMKFLSEVPSNAFVAFVNSRYARRALSTRCRSKTWRNVVEIICLPFTR